MFLTDFQLIRPRFECKSNEDTLDWLVEAHVKAEGMRRFAPLSRRNFGMWDANQTGLRKEVISCPI